MLNQPELKSKRLLLRAFQLGDAHEVNKLAGNINVAKTTLSIPHPYTAEMAESWIGTHKLGWDEKTNIIYAITLRQGRQLLGAIGLHDIKSSQTELGYWIGEPYWGKGYCTEAVNILLSFSSEKLNLNKIISHHLVSNPASGAVMKKAGMRHINRIQNYDRYGNLADIEFYELNRQIPE